MKSIFTTVSLIALAATYATGAEAQTINYGSMQDLFGEAVTTSATGKPQKASEVPVAMDIITADDIRRSGAQSIPQILSRVSGVVNWQATRSWSDVGIRGQNSTLNPTLLVLVNGRQTYIDSYGYTDWTLIPVQLEEIRQIEVVKGPNTALFGFNAVSGVVNIVTYNPKYDKINEVGATVGTGQYRKGQAVVTVSPTDWASVRISGSLMGDNEFNKSSKTAFQPGIFQPENHFQNVNLDSIFQLNGKTQLRVEAGDVDGSSNDAVFYTNSLNRKRASYGKATLTSQTSIGLVEADAYVDHLGQTSFSPAAGTFNEDNTVQVAQLQDLFKIGTDHSFRVMGEYRYNTLQSPGLIGSGADVFYSVFAGSAMWNWAITPKWELTNAVRVDTLKLGRSGGSLVVPFTSNEDFDHRTTAVSENTGLVWKATDADTLRASFARGIQAPSLISSGLALSLFGGAVTDVGQPTLNPAVVTNYELGYDRAISAINGKFRSDVYYKRTQDVFEIGTTAFLSGPTTVQQAGNIGNTHTEGAELGLSGKFLQDWSWDASYAYQTTNDNFSVNTIAFTVPTNFQDTFPHHIVNAHIGWAKGPWEADLYGQADSSFKAISNTAVAGTYKLVNLNRFGTVSARVAYTLDPGITVALSGLDVSQTSTATNAGLEEERQVFLSLSKKF